ncbi:flagellar hook-associated protein FlgK [Tepidibacillus fermentans]|uniref:Flagellar hook-associated protein 1 n=1 Tax=Tepidibacillus fermentans TaxID=1281767 RepID=A0A4R3KJH3_9BACI|nr:flagellar hook-associated protein FlgK [Tepidibacillus fermentans]TCS83321.1 flagellar hook-associated protein 1 FlgK [Tepidibacillus fermentans]
MRSTFHNLETAKRGLFAAQTAIQTTGHNIANANTKGYTRQAVDFVASKPMEALAWTRSTSPGQLGTGVDYSNIRRLRDSYLDGQFRNQNQNFGDWEVRQSTFEKLEAIINEPSDYGIRTVIDHFWNAWQDLAGQPDNLTARSVVIERAAAMTDALNDVAQKLEDLKSDLVESLKVKLGSGSIDVNGKLQIENIGDVNTLLTQIAKLNEQIYQVEAQGDHANDLRDQRDLLTDQLSKLIDITVKDEKDNSGYTITLSNGTQLVKANHANQVYMDSSNPSALKGFLYDPETKTITDLTPNTQTLKDVFSSGEVHGYLQSIEEVEKIQSQLDDLVNGLVSGNIDLTLVSGTQLPPNMANLLGLDATNYDSSTQTVTKDVAVKVPGINGLHQMGYDLNSNPGIEFFTKKDNTKPMSASNIQVNTAILNDVTKIATSNRLENGVVLKGNNQIALWIADMRYTKIEGIGSSDEYFRSMVGNLGVRSQEAVRQYKSQKVLVEQVDHRRQAVSGVSLDEEMADLIKYQHAYNASARMITAIDEMLDKVINGMGIVGR